MSSPSRSGMNGDMLSRLNDFAGSAETQGPASKAAAGKPLPDVNTMIERLAARLETAPDDIKGWRMLGWSYFNTGRYEQAAAAYAKAVALDPNSSELKLSYEQAKAKASGGTVSPLQTGPPAAAVTTCASRRAPGPKRCLRTRATLQSERWSMAWQVAWRVLRDDVDGWARLMRSRVVLGEREVAATAFRKALEIFKDDQAASGKITAAAIELGLKAE